MPLKVSFGSVPALIRGESSSTVSSDGFSIGSRSSVWSAKSVYRFGIARVRRHRPQSLKKEPLVAEPSIVFNEQDTPTYSPSPEELLSEAEIAQRIEWLNMIVCGPKSTPSLSFAWDSNESLAGTEFFTPYLDNDRTQYTSCSTSDVTIPTIVITPPEQESTPCLSETARGRSRKRYDASMYLSPNAFYCAPRTAPYLPDTHHTPARSESRTRDRRPFGFKNYAPHISSGAFRNIIPRHLSLHHTYSTIKGLLLELCSFFEPLRRLARAQALRLLAYFFGYIILPLAFAWWFLEALPQRMRTDFQRWKCRE